MGRRFLSLSWNERPRSKLTMGSLTGFGSPLLAHVFKSVSGHLDQDLRTTAQAEQGIRGTSVRKLFEEAAGGGFILRSQFSPCLSMASALASRSAA